MPTTMVTSTGFVRLPESILRQLGILPGDRIELRPLERGRVQMGKAMLVQATLPDEAPRPFKSRIVDDVFVGIGDMCDERKR